MTEPTPNHYEVLGVAKDATPEQIKQAWRRASSAAHPDREGGSQQRQQAVNVAYEVLGDPERRKRYDETGSSREPTSLQQEAFGAVASCFQAALAKNASDPITYARMDFAEAQHSMRSEIEKAKRMIAALTKKRGQVKVKKEGVPNILHDLIDQQVQQLQNTITGNTHLIEVAKASLTILDDYEFTGELRPDSAPSIMLMSALEEEVMRMAGLGRGWRR